MGYFSDRDIRNKEDRPPRDHGTGGTPPLHTQQFITGRRGCVACIEATDYMDECIAVLTAEATNVTQRQMERYIRGHFPDGATISWYSPGDGYIGARVVYA